MMTIFEWVLGRQRVRVSENERVLYLVKGQVRDILGPGEHLVAGRGDRLLTQRHSLNRPEFVSDYEHALFDKLPDVASKHFEVFRTAADEVAVLERDGAVYAVLGPDAKLVVWRDAGPWRVTVLSVSEMPAVEPVLLRRLARANETRHVASAVVPDGHAGLMYVDTVFDRRLEPGLHAFWAPGREVRVRMIDLKRQALEVAGQEMLTRDRVTIRVNIAAEYRVVDPVKAVASVEDFVQSLYRALQIAFRRTVGAMSLDQILEKKVSVDAEAADTVRAEMAAIGLEVSEITLKDVILPGEMRDILNKVVAAEKEAEANVIRRREETNATRSLLNTAKVMADNPVMLRLKELEALETVAAKVERITVHNGTGGLLNDLVRLSDK